MNHDADNLYIWTVTFDTKDYPGRYCARKHFIGRGGVYGPTDTHVTGDTLDQVRGLLPDGLTRLPRSVNDQPVIVESWI